MSYPRLYLQLYKLRNIIFSRFINGKMKFRTRIIFFIVRYLYILNKYYIWVLSYYIAITLRTRGYGYLTIGCNLLQRKDL